MAVDRLRPVAVEDRRHQVGELRLRLAEGERLEEAAAGGHACQYRRHDLFGQVDQFDLIGPEIACRSQLLVRSVLSAFWDGEDAVISRGVRAIVMSRNRVSLLPMGTETVGP